MGNKNKNYAATLQGVTVSRKKGRYSQRPRVRFKPPEGQTFMPVLDHTGGMRLKAVPDTRWRRLWAHVAFVFAILWFKLRAKKGTK